VRVFDLGIYAETGELQIEQAESDYNDQVGTIEHKAQTLYHILGWCWMPKSSLPFLPLS
jgi:hypothetical protein